MSRIPELNKEAMEACQLYVDNLIKPIHSLGKLEEIAVRIAGVTGKVKPSYLNRIRLTLKASSRRRSSAARTSATLPWMMK